MNHDESSIDDLIQRAAAGNESAMAELFDLHRNRLRKMIQIRLDRRLQGRVDASDVLQDAYLDLARKLPSYAENRAIPFPLWVRLVVGERLLRVHRYHLGAAMRDAGREISIHQGGTPQVGTESLAAQLMGRLTSASMAVARAELQHSLQNALNGMEPLDREVIALRHFEELSNDETAAILGVSKAAASKRYVRALLKLKAVFNAMAATSEASLGGVR
jgi:RNA polymerase sigma-70 factor (ECF subfamily)